MKIDHVILGVGDLEKAARRFLAEYGLASVEGGVHPDAGTGNRIIPLGDAYVELLAVLDSERAASHPLGRLLLEETRRGDRPVGWMVYTDDLDSVARRLNLSPLPMSRLRPDGSRLTWRLAGLDEALRNPALPAFIQWDSAPEDHPGRTPVEHPLAVRGLEEVEVSCERRILDQWLGDADLPVRRTTGNGTILSATIVRAGGERIVL